MTLEFPPDFLWGTSTAAGTIETASDHNFRGIKAKDGHLFQRTTDHERRRMKDVDHIARFGQVYRCSVDWARLQAQPYAAFNKTVVDEYRDFFQALNGRGMKIMLVLHHYTHPMWFEDAGGWAWESNLEIFYDYSARIMEAFGDLVFAWNTFNEPNAYALYAYHQGKWPPYEKSLPKASRVMGNMARAHVHVYKRLKEKFPTSDVGYSLNTVFAEGRGFKGQTAAKLFDWWYYKRAIKLFEPTDFVGISYYTHLIFAPDPIDVVNHPDQVKALGLPHDQMWVLKPEGLAYNIQRAHADTSKPIWVTENGVSTGDSEERISLLTKYLQGVYGCIREGIPLKGYIHWSTWDNFEWHLGPRYQFGLLRLNLATLDRENTPAADWYEALCQQNALDV